MSDVNSIIQELKKAKKIIGVFSPTLKSSIDIAPITLAQQSKIIETVANITSSASSPILAILEFNNVMYSILKKNISEYQPVFNTIDRTNFILALKGYIDSVVTTDDNVDFDIKKMLERNESLELEVAPESVTVDDITFHLTPPSMDDDHIVNGLILRKYRSNSSNRSLLSDVYHFESLKFIKAISVGDQTLEVRKDTKSLDIIKELDTVQLRPVYDYIGKVRAAEEALTNHLTADEQLDITPDLFIS
tara:strand:- start:1051 stop:1794 length:744 start_codon:yes stop_codon:yes gene_type:complete